TTCKEAIQPLTGFGRANIQGQMGCAWIGRFHRMTALACHSKFDAVPDLEAGELYLRPALLGRPTPGFHQTARLSRERAAACETLAVLIVELVARLPSLPYRRGLSLAPFV